jgi:hypothetical protein
MGESDELFRYLEKEFHGDRAAPVVKELRASFRKYMTELGPGSVREKAAAFQLVEPNADPVEVMRVANLYAVADGIMTAVALHLARSQA